MSLEKIVNYKMIKSEDLNHHGTLFAGRCSEWFVESAFIGAASKLDPKHTVCLKIHGLEFLQINHNRLHPSTRNQIKPCKMLRWIYNLL